MICMTISSPFLRGKNTSKERLITTARLVEEKTRLARLNDVAKRRANKLLDSKPLFYGRKRDRSSNFQADNKLRNFAFATQFQ